MRWGRTLLVLGMGMLVGIAGTPACADPLDSPIVTPSADQLSGGSRPAPALYFAGFDVWRLGYGGYGGAEWIAATRGDLGFVVRVFGAGSLDLYKATTTTFRTRTISGAILPGIRFSKDKFEVKAFAGLDMQSRIQLDPNFVYLQRPHVGLRVTADLWWEPTDQAMIAVSLSGTTIGSGRTGRVALGWRVFDACWIGPEALASADVYSTQFRVGGHLTGLRVAGIEWSAGAGYLQDSLGRTGAYGRLAVSMRR